MNERRLLKALPGNTKNRKIRDYYGGILHEDIDKKRIKFLRDNFVEAQDGDVIFVLTLRDSRKRKR